MLGAYNVRNALAAIAVGAAVGLNTDTMADGLRRFRGVRRRMQLRGTAAGVTVYDDFAHHPTAIDETLDRGALRTPVPPRSGRSSSRGRRRRAAASSRRTSPVRWARAASRHPAGRLPFERCRKSERLDAEEIVRDLRSADVDARFIPATAISCRRLRGGRERRSRRRHVERRLRRHPSEAPGRSTAREAAEPRTACNRSGSSPPVMPPSWWSCRSASIPLINATLVAPCRRAPPRLRSAVIRDAVVGYCTLTVYFDPLSVDASWLEGEIRALALDADAVGPLDGSTIEVPVCYGGDLGPDLDDVAAQCAGAAKRR